MKTDNRHFKAKLYSIKSIANNTYEMTFSAPEEFKFKAGQYVWVEIEGIRRAFSISSPPGSDNKFSIIFRSGESKFKKYILLTSEDSEINMVGPFGSSFVINEENREKPIVMVGGGVGIAPFLSIFLDSKNFKNQNLKLISINSTRERNFYADLFKDERCVQIVGEYDLKNFESYTKDLADWFISGPQGMVDKVYAILLNLGVAREKMFFEQFYPSSELSNVLSQRLLKRELPKDVFEVAVEGSSRHVIITDINGSILYANPAAQKITGYSFEEMKGNSPRLWGGLMSPEFYRELWAKKLASGSFDGEIINRRKNGEIYVALAHIDPIRNEQGKLIGFVASEEDITSIKNVEEDLIRKQKDLEKLNRFMINREIKMIDLKKKLYDKNSKI